MKRPPRIWSPLSIALVVVGCGGAQPKGTAPSSPSSARQALPRAGSAAGAKGSDLLVDAPAVKEEPEPSTAGDPDARTDPATGLSFAVLERGPDRLWRLRVVNTGQKTVHVVADPRLLWFSVKTPGKRKTTVCQLPSELFPDEVEPRLAVELEPGEGIADTFDPRLYCYATSGQTTLVPGALVEPHFGWPEPKPKIVWRGGKREERPAEPRPPFVANIALDEERSLPGVKELRAEPFALRSTYAEWSKTRLLPVSPEGSEDDPLSMEIVQGSDAHAERNATIQLRLKNHSERKLSVFFRRELVTFEVTGSSGVTTCPAASQFRAPDPMSYLTLGAREATTLTCELAELCPPGTFGAPGLYLVHARFEAEQTGDPDQSRVYAGSVVSPQPGLIRIRTGEIPFLSKHPMRVIERDGLVRDVSVEWTREPRGRRHHPGRPGGPQR